MEPIMQELEILLIADIISSDVIGVKEKSWH